MIAALPGNDGVVLSPPSRASVLICSTVKLHNYDDRNDNPVTVTIIINRDDISFTLRELRYFTSL